MSLPVVLRAAQRYADLEAKRLASPTSQPAVLPDFSGLKSITFREGFAHLLIDARHQPRTFDVPIAFVLKVTEALGGNLLLNSRDRRVSAARAYVRIDIGDTHVYANRAIMNAETGFVVRERGVNFRSHLPEDFVMREASLRDGSGKHITGRRDLIEALLAAYDKAGSTTSALITRTAFENLLTRLFVLADERAHERKAARQH